MSTDKQESDDKIVASDDGLERIFSGDYSRDMWDEINSARTVRDLRHALYFVCCRLQEFESRVDTLQSNAVLSGAANEVKPT